MKKKNLLIIGITLMVLAIAIITAVAIKNRQDNQGATDGQSQVSFDANKQLIVSAGVRQGQAAQTDDRTIYIDTLVLRSFFTKDNVPVSRHTEWGTAPNQLTKNTTSMAMEGLGEGEGEYVELSADVIPASEAQPGARYYYRTVLTVGDKVYKGAVSSLTALK